MAEFPENAKAVIIGLGGIAGASVAHHLIERGWDDIVGIDKSAIPTDIGSTSHASDFCYATSHDFLSCWTTLYSIDFFERMGHYAKVGGLEIARVGDDARMDEIKRKVASGKAFGTGARLVSPAEIKKKFPLIDEDMVQGGMWDPDAGLVVPRSQVVSGILVDNAEKTGKLKAFANTPATGLMIENGRIRGVETPRGKIMADYVIVCAGLWGRFVAGMAGEDLPVMPVDHPLLWFGPYEEFAGTGKDIGWPLLRDQGNSAYMRDTGDPKTTEGGMIEWGYYEETEPRLCHPRDLLEKAEARLSPSQRDLEIDQVMEPLERAMELTPILAELGYDEKRSFNGLLQVTTDGGPSIGESQDVRGLWYAVAIWVKDGPGMGKLIADWITDGRTEIDHHAIDYARFYPFQTDENFIHARCTETAMKIYNPAVHPREPFAGGRDARRSPFYEREKELGGYFMELGGWERAHGYASNAHLLEKYGNQVPVRENEWDNRHFWRVSNAEHLEMSANVGMVNLSHFAMYDVTGPDHISFTVFRMEDRYRFVDGADAGNRDFVYMKRMAEDLGYDVEISDVSTDFTTIGLWGPNARTTLQEVVEDPDGLTHENFPFASIKQIRIAGKNVAAFRISYVGEQGWELHMKYEDGLAVWDAIRAQDIMRLGCDPRAGHHAVRCGDLCQFPQVGKELASPKRRPLDRVQSS
jgi:glycine/D-amino acid oxidase-like deaminating enzyme